MELQKRTATRLKWYDYSQNDTYFIAIYVKDRKNLLSRIIDAE